MSYKTTTKRVWSTLLNSSKALTLMGNRNGLRTDIHSAPRTVSKEKWMSISRAKRWRVSYPVQLVAQHFLDEAQTVDISVRGLSIATSRSIRKGTQVYVRLLLPDGKSCLDYDICTVRWSAEGRIGLEASEISTHEEQRLQQCLPALATSLEVSDQHSNCGMPSDQPPAKFRHTIGLLWQTFLRPLIPSHVNSQSTSSAEKT